MKNYSYRLYLFALAALLITPPSAHAQSESYTSASRSGPSARFEFKWTRHYTADLIEAQGRLQSIKKAFQSGSAPAEEVKFWELRVQDSANRMPYVLGLQSKGGPLSALLPETSGQGLEVSLTLINAGEPADLETELPPFDLRNVNWGTIIGVLQSLLISRGLDLKFVGGDSQDPGTAKSVICVLRRIDPPSETKRSSQAEVESVQLGDYLSGEQTVDVIVDAIRTAWELDPKHDSAALRLKFHPGTKILFVSGPASATAIARQVAAGLRKNPVPR